MSEGINRVIVAGNLGADPDIRYTQGGSAILKLRVAVGERYKDQSGEWKDKTEWVNVVVFGKRAEALVKILGKGMTVCVEGKLRTTSYEKDGAKRYSTEVAADSVVIAGGKGGGRPATGEEPQRGGTPAGGFDKSASADDFYGSDDDIPF